MVNVSLAAIIAGIVLIVAMTIGSVKSGLPNVFMLLILFTVGIIGYLLARGHEKGKETEGLLQSQVKFYDFIFKAITIFLALAAILFYKDRQDMKNDYESRKKELERQYVEAEKKIAGKVDSLIRRSGSQLNAAISQANISADESRRASHTLKRASAEASESERNLRAAAEKAKMEHDRLKALREEMHEWFSTQEKQLSIPPFEVPLQYCTDTTAQPMDFRWYNNIALDYFYRRNKDKAKKLMTTSLELNRRNRYALMNMAGMNYTENRFGEALPYLNEYIQFFPDEPGGYLGKALCLIELDSIDQAVDALRKAISLGFHNYALIEMEFCPKSPAFDDFIPRELRMPITK